MAGCERGKMPAPRLLTDTLFRSSDDEGGDKQVQEPVAKRAVCCDETTLGYRGEENIFKRINGERSCARGDLEDERQLATWRGLASGWQKQQQMQGFRARE